MPQQTLTSQARRQRHRQETIDAIIDISRAIMREHGVAALNLHEIARQMGMKTTSLYAYFPNKMALYEELFRLGVQLFRERMDRADNAGATAWERLRTAAEAYMSFAQENPELYQLVFEHPVPGFALSEESKPQSWAALEAGQDSLARALHSDELETDLPPALIVDLILALVHGLTALHMANEPQLPVGSGRFGSLIPAAVGIFQAAWRPVDGTSSLQPANTPATASPFVWERS